MLKLVQSVKQVPPPQKKKNITHFPKTMLFVTYNLLSSALRTKNSFPHTRPSQIDKTFRIQDILNKLESVITHDNDVGVSGPVVFGLQEVSVEWVPVLRDFFEKFDYSFTYTCYGNHYNGYMGVALACPKNNQFVDAFEVKGFSIKCPPKEFGHGPFRQWKFTQQQLQSARPWYKKAWSFFKSYLPCQPLLDRLAAPKPRFEQSMITCRFNRALFATVTLRHIGDVAVGVYHMPCLFKFPTVMAVHLVCFLKTLQRYCNDQNLHKFVVMMDGNFEYNSLCYRLLFGTASAQDLDKISKVSPGNVTRSLMEFVRGTEHTYPVGSPSTHTIGFTGNEFTGKIDYIFYKLGEPTVIPQTALAKLQTIDEHSEHLPNAEEPSDHFMLVGELVSYEGWV